ncbi:hypothetical protein BDV95DRAFT_651738 [Massariosphaeria phaeospora]|uniref:Uncharacterized protein n=1 Tax=Massariosphaeria phaeospora TaxID=100035 RepID=A0A7C8I6L0_9PLEO|nr:hypothetical protein BDV95DRAFT_651738 [Massariosphaeria phaeospora]
MHDENPPKHANSLPAMNILYRPLRIAQAYSASDNPEYLSTFLNLMENNLTAMKQYKSKPSTQASLANFKEIASKESENMAHTPTQPRTSLPTHQRESCTSDIRAFHEKNKEKSLACVEKELSETDKGLVYCMELLAAPFSADYPARTADDYIDQLHGDLYNAVNYTQDYSQHLATNADTS